MEIITSLKKNIPNFLTSLNILCGTLAITLSYQGKEFLIYACIFIAIASVFDFLDGFSARLLNAYSELGKQLDSLADMISFGMAPAVIMYTLMKEALGINKLSFSLAGIDIFFISIPFLIVIFSGLRLAKFNIDTRQTTQFIGLNTPSNAIFIASFPVMLYFYPDSAISAFIQNKYFLTGVIFFESYMLISALPMFSLKIKKLNWSNNKTRYTFLAVMGLMFVFMGIKAIVFLVPLYILLSLIEFLSLKNIKTPT